MTIPVRDDRGAPNPSDKPRDIRENPSWPDRINRLFPVAGSYSVLSGDGVTRVHFWINRDHLDVRLDPEDISDKYL